MFSRPSLSGHPNLKVMGFAPMAVLPAHHKTGIGSALVRASLEQCKQLDFVVVVVLGHPEYYPRFDFSPSSHFGIESAYDVPDEVFMAMELWPEALSGKIGSERYDSAFNNI